MDERAAWFTYPRSQAITLVAGAHFLADEVAATLTPNSTPGLWTAAVETRATFSVSTRQVYCRAPEHADFLEMLSVVRDCLQGTTWPSTRTLLPAAWTWVWFVMPDYTLRRRAWLEVSLNSESRLARLRQVPPQGDDIQMPLTETHLCMSAADAITAVIVAQRVLRAC